MELIITVQDVSALLLALANTTFSKDKEQTTVQELQLAIKALSYLIAQPNIESHAGNLPEALGIEDDSECKLLYGLVNRFLDVFSTSPYAHISLNTATMLDDPWD